MKKILIVINSLSIGGAERLVVDQANYLENMGYMVDVLTIIASPKPGFYHKLNLARGRHLSLNIKDSTLKGAFSIWKVIKQGRYDAIVSHLFLANTIVRLVKVAIFSKIKIISFEHNVYDKEKKLKHLIIDYILSFLTYKIVAVSAVVEQYLIKNKIPKNKIVVIENGISDDFINKLSSRAETIKRLGFSEEDFLIVSSGNVNPQKSYETLIDASVGVIRKNPNVHFLVCGSDTSQYAKSLKDRVIEQNLDKNFHFLGSRLDALDIVNAAHVFIMPSIWEGLSISLLEALLIGKVIVVSNIESLTSIIKNGYNGTVFDVGDAGQLGEILNEIIQNPSKYEEYRNNARITGNKYSIDANVKNLLSLID